MTEAECKTELCERIDKLKNKLGIVQSISSYLNSINTVKQNVYICKKLHMEIEQYISMANDFMKIENELKKLTNDNK